ncbi:MAG: replication initiation protein, partial [Endomicrobium sp.]|nr:replication initiation protein [Endomicrobium sp.]
MDLNQKNEQQKHLPMRKTIIEKPSFFLKFADTFTSVWCHRLLSFFILLLLGRVSRKEDLRNSYQINVRDMIALLSSDHDRVNDSNFKQKIFDAVKSMVEKVVEIQMTTTEKLKFCLFEKINNIKNSSIIEVVPTKEFLDCFLHYKNDVYFINSSHGFVKEDLSEFFKLSRYYSQKLYEYFLAFEWVPEKMISVSYDKLLAILSPPSSM